MIAIFSFRYWHCPLLEEELSGQESVAGGKQGLSNFSASFGRVRRGSAARLRLSEAEPKLGGLSDALDFRATSAPLGPGFEELDFTFLVHTHYGVWMHAKAFGGLLERERR